MKYNYWNLSDIEFEQLCRDIISKKEWLEFESFKKWKDWWIDLIYSQLITKWWSKIVVQCKHYIKSKFSNLKSDLLTDKKNKKSELSKLKLLNEKYKIDRYIVMTSLELSPPQKEELLEWFWDFIKSTSDIISLNDIEGKGLITDDILKKNPKLFLSSYEILNLFLDDKVEEIKWEFNKWIKNRSLIKKESIINNIHKFVAIPKITDALESLKENNVVIISWDPWIWKSTLADILTFLFIKDNSGYDFIEISKDIEEWYDLLFKSEKQVFYYDDFLWRSSYKWSNNNEWKRINLFIEKLKDKSNKNKKLIFTTRNWVLDEASEKDEYLNSSNIHDYNIIINLNDYNSLTIKWKILYNHIYFSKLDKSYLNNFFENQNYLKIIQHNNYTPRLIDEFTNKSIIEKAWITPDVFIDFIFNSLNNPEKIRWKSYDNLDKNIQLILIILNIYEYWISDSDLHNDLIQYIWTNISYRDFKWYLKLIDSSFIEITKKWNYFNSKLRKFVNDNHLKIYYKNPSISDFIRNEIIKKDKIIIEKLIKSFIKKDELFNFILVYFKDDEKINLVFQEEYLKLIHLENKIELKTKMYLNLIQKYKLIPNSKIVEIKNQFKDFLDNNIFNNNKIIEDKSLFVEIFDIFYYLSNFSYFNYIEDWVEDLDNDKVEEFKESIEQYVYDFDLYKDKYFLNKLCFLYEENDLEFTLRWKEIIQEYIEYHNLDNTDIDDISEIENNIDELEILNSDSINYFFSDIIENYISELEEKKEELEEKENNDDNIYEPDFDIDRWWWKVDELEEIRDMFER